MSATTITDFPAAVAANSAATELAGARATKEHPTAKSIKPTYDWAVVASAPATNDGASDGTTITNPISLDNTTHNRIVNEEGRDTLQVRLQYPTTGLGAITDPVVEVFGLDANGVCARLKTVGGADNATLADAAGDVTIPNGRSAYTAIAEFVVTGWRNILVGIKTKFAATEATKSVTGATNASPIVITSVAHGYSDGDVVRIYGVLGNTAANGIFTVANKTDDTFELTGSTGNAAYTSGGTITKVLDATKQILARLI